MSASYKTTQSSYRWVILAIAWATILMGIAAQFQVAALAFKIIPDLNLSLTQFSIVFSAPMLGAVFLSIFSGMLGDRFGVKKVVTFGFAVSTFGMYFRYAAHDFITFFLVMFLSGICPALLNANIAKLIGAWYSREQMGTAMGIVLSGNGLGMTIGLSTATLFPTSIMAYKTAGYIMLIIGVFWVMFIKDKPSNVPENLQKPAAQYLREVSRSKNVWLVGLGLMFYMGCNMVFSGNFANALITARGADPQTASIMTSVVTFGTVFGSILGPLCAERIGKIKPFLAPISILGAVVMYFAWISSGVITWILLAILGFFMGICIPLLMSYPMLLPEIGPAYAGSAGGLIATLQLSGACFIPSFIVAPLAKNSFDMMFILASLCYLLSGIITHFLPEMGSKNVEEIRIELDAVK
ncbi:nitrate/nitrite transporter [Desulfitobacterium sp. Sab5]|uniref:MFS transporter n=1 Tax=Desulfitobacterium nosdiversum TaxID=3375356 RepID=UPI003CF27A14